MAGQQREISVSEFFTKNRHLLGFDNPRKALLTTVKEAVDNALDACEEAGILPFVEVSIERVAARGRAAADAPPAEGAALPLFEGKPPEPAKPVADEDDDDAGPRKRGVAAPPERFVVSVEDNGPGIVKEQVAKIFGKLLYGSKFHRLRQSLTADQPVLVERRGRVERLPIGELVDGFLREGEDLADVSECGLRAPAFDRASGRYAWSPVSHVIRHPRAQEVLEIRTECGRSVRVTGCHSLFTFDSDVVRVREVEARRLRPGDFVVAPRRLPAPRARHRVNLLDELRAEDLRVRWIYVYGVPRPLLRRLRRGAEIVHRVGADRRSRRHFRVRTRGHDALEVLDESWSQYEAKGFLPAWIAKDLGLESECSGARLRTYYHGRPVETPVTWRLTPSLMRMLGLFVAEGHSDRRQIAFTFGSHERAYVDEVVASARRLGLSSSVEQRDRHAIRVKLFGGAVDLLFPAWCGRGAKGKRVPWFVFGARTALRQHFLDALCQGDGHRVRGRDVLMFGSASEVLRDDVDTLWLLQGVVASRSRPVRQRGLGRDPSTSWRVDVHGADLDRSHVFRSERAGARGNRYRSLPFALTGSDALLPSGRVAPTTERLLVAAGLGRGPGGVRKSKAIFEGLRRGREYTTTDLARLCGERVTRHLPEHMVSLGLMKRSGAAYRGAPGLDRLRGRVRAAIEFGRSDLCLLQITEVRRVEDANPFVYDLCVPGRENFVAGNGALACHNSRGQQGIGISAAGMYGQLTTGKAVRIWSRTSKKKPAHFIEMHMDLRKNAPEVTKDETVEWEREHATGTKVAIELEAKYQKGAKSVDDYLRQTALANPHVTIRYRDPDGGDTLIERAVKTLPEPSREIQP
ncbi:MAG TPA: hypothetical protein VFS92_08635, partial [Planctomycetota bacterium]|nr:hypothetical protein [Planctomycetota bacterium]